MADTTRYRLQVCAWIHWQIPREEYGYVYGYTGRYCEIDYSFVHGYTGIYCEIDYMYLHRCTSKYCEIGYRLCMDTLADTVR